MDKIESLLGYIFATLFALGYMYTHQEIKKVNERLDELTLEIDWLAKKAGLDAQPS